MSQSLDLDGRTVLITGASSGLGARFALAAAAAGAKLALAARRIDRLESLAREITAAGGVAHPVAMDVTDEASVIAGFDGAQAALGPIDTVDGQRWHEQRRPGDRTWRPRSSTASWRSTCAASS